MYDDPPQTFNSLRSNQNMYHNLLHAFNTLWGSQNWLAEPLQGLNRHCNNIVKRGRTIFYRLSTLFLVVKICLADIYRASTSFAVVKPGFRTTTVLQLALVLSKLACSTSAGLQHTSWQSKYLAKLLQSFSKLCSSKNGFESLHASKQLCSYQNVLTEHLQAFNRLCSAVVKTCDDPPQAFNTLCGSRNRLAEPL